MSQLQHQDSITTDPNKMANIVAEYYTSLYKSNPPTIPEGYPKLELPLPLTQNKHSSIIAPIDITTVKDTIKILPRRKSPGPDGIPYEIYSKNKDRIAPHLVALFNHVISTSIPIPEGVMLISLPCLKKETEPTSRTGDLSHLQIRTLKYFLKSWQHGLDLSPSELYHPANMVLSRIGSFGTIFT